MGKNAIGNIRATCGKSSVPLEGFQEEGEAEAGRPCLIGQEGVLVARKGPIVDEIVRVPDALRAIPLSTSVVNAARYSFSA